jgi:hypothetical protein
MKLKHVNSLKGTGTIKDDDSYSSRPFIDYLQFMLNVLIMLVLFCYITANNYLNVKEFDPTKDYPIGDTLKSIINTNSSSNEQASPYCSTYMACKSVSLNEPLNVSKFSLWLQTTQESCYRLGGMGLHYYFKFMQKLGIGADSGIPYTDILPLIRWVIFGLITVISIGLMMSFVWIIFIPGWFGGLFAFNKLKTTDINQLALFCLSAFLTICFGWISIFPVIYEFFYLIYLFFFKQLAVNSDKLGPEFTKRMSNLMTGFVIVAVIVAAMQLPLESAGVIGGIILLATLFMKNKSTTKSA